MKITKLIVRPDLDTVPPALAARAAAAGAEVCVGLAARIIADRLGNGGPMRIVETDDEGPKRSPTLTLDLYT